MANLRVAGGTKEATTLTKKGKFFDYTLLIVVLFLIAFGLVMVYSTSSYSGLQDANDSAFYFKKQLKSSIIGLVFMFIVICINYRVWYKCSWIIYIGSVISVLLVLTPLGMTFNGARRWIGIGGMSIQPAEIMKLGLIITLAAFVSLSGKRMSTFKNNLAYLVLTGIAAGLIMVITNNLSTAIIIVGIAYIMLIVANPKPQWIIIGTVAAIAAVAVFLVVFFKNADDPSGFGFRFKRLLAWRHPEDYASGIGYQTLQALYAIGSGGFFGKGLGNSIQKLGFIPEAQNDMIFSVVCEELGLFGGICVIVLFALMIWRFMVIANNAPDLFGSMLVVGVLAHIAIQVVLNIAVVTNTIPNTGITLPFISYGGTSVLFLMIEMGIVLNVSGQIRVPVPVGREY
ncbi:MAG: FtsW/RodA/SpoVE family cell cycle protein [Butyrivibrio sp.]